MRSSDRDSPERGSSALSAVYEAIALSRSQPQVTTSSTEEEEEDDEEFSSREASPSPPPEPEEQPAAAPQVPEPEAQPEEAPAPAPAPPRAAPVPKESWPVRLVLFLEDAVFVLATLVLISELARFLVQWLFLRAVVFAL